MNLVRPTVWARAARALPILGTSIAALLAPPAHAGLESWNAFGVGPFNWNDNLSWLDGTAPLAADPTLDVVFPGGSGATVTNNDIAGLLLNTLTLQGGVGETVSIAGNTLDFRTDGTTPAITQSGAGGVTISAGVVATNTLGLNGGGTGVVALTGVVSGAGGLTVSSGNWQLQNAANTFSGNLSINTGAFVEVIPSGAGNQAVNLTPAAATFLGSNTGNVITINGGTLKITTKGNGGNASGITVGGRAITFAANGGTLDLRNTSGVAGSQGGGILTAAGGDLNLTLNNTAGNPAVVQFNGGQNGHSTGSATDGNWSVANNVLRIASLAGTGPLRVEVTNGAMYAQNVGTVNLPVTVRGVVGGDPTSGPTAAVNAGISTNLGRFGVNTNIANFTQTLRLEDAIQIHGPGTTRALDGNIVVVGSAGGHAGYVAFNGRSTGAAALGAGINAPGAGGANQNPLWIGQGQNDTLTIENGGIAVFDLRIRYEQANHNGVVLDGRAIVQGGGQLRMAQSISNFSFNAAAVTGASTTANVGDHVIRGDIEGQGSTAAEAIVDLQLPAPQVVASTGVPEIMGTPATNTRPHGGLRFEDTTGNADFIVNGSGFGGLRINGSARPNALFSGATPDPVSTLTKINDALPAARLNRVTGTGGYLTIAPADQTYTVPVGGEWSDADVGLKVVNHNSTGVDVSLGSLSTWGRNLAVDTGATLDLGAASPFTLTAGTLHGTGTVSGTGSLQINSGANVSPGLGGVGTLTVGNLTLDGSLLLDATSTPAVDLLGAGNLTLGGSSVLSINAGSTFNNSPYTIATYSGTLTGTFGSVSGLPIGYSVDYGTAGVLRLIFTTVGNKIWNGTPGAVWSTNPADANWQGGQAFNNLDTVTFDDTAAGLKTVTINGLVSVSTVTVNTASTYFLNGNFAGSAMTGSGSLTKTGTGTLELNGAHNYSGGTIVNQGTLRVGSNDSLPDLGPVTIASGATLDLNGKTETVSALILNGNLTAGNLTVGALTLGGGANVPANLTLSGDVTKTGAASTISGTVDLDGGNRSFNVATSAAPELTISGVVSNGSLTKTGTGTLVLSSASNAQSTTVVNGGTLRVGVAGAIPTGGTATTGGSGVLDLNNIPHTFSSLNNSGITATGGAALTVTSLSGAAPGAIQMGGGLLTLNPASGTTTYGGAITGTGTQVIKQGAGNITLTGASTYTGGLDIQAGRVNASGGAGGTGGINVNPGTGLQLIGNLTGNVTVSGATVSSAADMTNAIGGNFNIAGNSLIHLNNEDNTTQTGDFAMTGTLRGTGNLDVSIIATAGADALDGFRLRGTGASNYSGVITIGQRVKLELQSTTAGNFSPMGTGSIVATAGTATGTLGGTYAQVQTRVNTANLSTNFGNNVTIAGAGVVNFNIIGAATTTGTLGNLTIGGGQSAFFNKNDNGIRTVAFSSVTLTGGNATFSVWDPSFGSTGADSVGPSVQLGAIGESTPGAGVTFKSAAATGATVVPIPHITVTGGSSYTGPTFIDSGILTVAATGSLSSSSRLEIKAGAKLDVVPFGPGGYGVPAVQSLTGVGDWDGRVALTGTLSPGINLGEIATMTGDDLTLNGLGVMQMNLSTVDNTSDRLSLTGAFTKGSVGGFQFDFEGGGTFDQTYTLVQFLSTDFNAADFSYTDLAPGLSGSFVLNGSDLQFAVVPEPGTAVLLLGGLGLIGLRRRNRR